MKLAILSLFFMMSCTDTYKRPRKAESSQTLALGVTYSGLHRTLTPTLNDIEADLAEIKTYFGPPTRVRTYYPQYNGGKIALMPLFEKNRINVLLGLHLFLETNWNSANYNDNILPYLKGQKQEAKYLDGILVGNENFTRNQEAQEVLLYLDKVKADSKGQTPVGTAQTSSFWLGTDETVSNLAKKCDFIAVNIYPGWNWNTSSSTMQPLTHDGKPMSPKAGLLSVIDTYNKVKAKFLDKRIIITEVGWPTSFGPKGSLEPNENFKNAQEFLREIKKWAQQNKVAVYYYSMFDDENAADAGSAYNSHFGLLKDNKMPKFDL